jgi:hypothetical protein
LPGLLTPEAEPLEPLVERLAHAAGHVLLEALHERARALELVAVRALVEPALVAAADLVEEPERGGSYCGRAVT